MGSYERSLLFSRSCPSMEDFEIVVEFQGKVLTKFEPDVNPTWGEAKPEPWQVIGTEPLDLCITHGNKCRRIRVDLLYPGLNTYAFQNRKKTVMVELGEKQTGELTAFFAIDGPHGGIILFKHWESNDFAKHLKKLLRF